MVDKRSDYEMKQTNCWIPIGEVDIPPILHKGFKENVIIRNEVEPIIKKKLEREDQKQEFIYRTQESEDQFDDETVLLVSPQYDSEAPTEFINDIPRMNAYLKRMKNGEIIKVDKEDFVIGKSASADYVIRDNPTISRRHAEIVKVEEGYYIKDLQSSNHTYVEQEKITEPVKLVNGMEIRLAEEIFIFSIMIEK